MLLDKLFHHLRHSPEREAFTLAGESLTFGELDRRARCWAASLGKLGVDRGDRVAVLLPTSLELIVALVGNYYAGAIHLPINTRYGVVETRHIIEDAEPTVIVHPASGEMAERVEEILGNAPSARPRQVRVGQGEFEKLTNHEPVTESRDLSDEDIALMIYTSGTTGKSKGVLLPYRAVVSNIDALTRLWRFTTEDDLVLALPLFHVHGLCIGIHGTLLRGSHATLQDGFRVEAVEAAIRDGGTVFMGVPTMYRMLVDAMDSGVVEAESFEGARLFTSGSAALSGSIFERFEDQTGHRILERYGMSETLLTLSNPYEGERRPGTVGMPVEGSEVRVVDEDFVDTDPGDVGQIVVRGSSLMKGYWRLPQKTEEAFRDGWFLTGDVATKAADGYISIVGRSSVDIIKSGGYKISAREIEEVLARHPNVEQVAVVGVDDPTWGEQIVAAVVPRSQPSDHFLKELQNFQREQLADFKTIRGLAIVEELPRNALGKVQKHRMHDLDFQTTS